jgi:hypothetical protein
MRQRAQLAVTELVFIIQPKAYRNESSMSFSAAIFVRKAWAEELGPEISRLK